MHWQLSGNAEWEKITAVLLVLALASLRGTKACWKRDSMACSLGSLIQYTSNHRIIKAGEDHQSRPVHQPMPTGHGLQCHIHTFPENLQGLKTSWFFHVPPPSPAQPCATAWQGTPAQGTAAVLHCVQQEPSARWAALHFLRVCWQVSGRL